MGYLCRVIFLTRVLFSLPLCVRRIHFKLLISWLTDCIYIEWDIFHFIVLNYELAKIHGGVGGALGGSSVIGAPPIIHFGAEEQKQKWLPGILTGELSFCLGATEPTGGSDLANLRTTAVKDLTGKFYIVNGNKVCLLFLRPITLKPERKERNSFI